MAIEPFPDTQLTPGSHDIPDRHQFGAAFAVPPAPSALSATASTGTATMPARADHVHPTTGLSSLSVSQVTIDFNNEFFKVVQVSDATVTATSKLIATIQKTSVDEPSDSGFFFSWNLLSVTVGAFVLYIIALDPDDARLGQIGSEWVPNLAPPMVTETIKFNYIVG